MSSSCPLEGRILNFRMARLSEIISSNMVPVSPFAIEFAAARLSENACISKAVEAMAVITMQGAFVSLTPHASHSMRLHR